MRSHSKCPLGVSHGTRYVRGFGPKRFFHPGNASATRQIHSQSRGERAWVHSMPRRVFGQMFGHGRDGNYVINLMPRWEHSPTPTRRREIINGGLAHASWQTVNSDD